MRKNKLSNAVFVDTWGWMALGYKQESRHLEVKEIYQELRSNNIPIYTSDYVLDELITLLFRRERFEVATGFMEGIFMASAKGDIIIERITPTRFLASWELRKRFQDKPEISFTDYTSMLIMKELGVHQVLTEDEHFLHLGMGFSSLP